MTDRDIDQQLVERVQKALETRVHEVRLSLDAAAWQALCEGYLTNQYYAADLWLDGTVVSQVGIRSRGGGTRNGTKPGLKVDLDRYVPGQSLHGYGSLVLDNLWSDPTFLRERLAFAVFEAMGFPAPRNAFARLSVNGEPWGLYAVVEPVARPFLSRALGEEERTPAVWRHLELADGVVEVRGEHGAVTERRP